SKMDKQAPERAARWTIARSIRLLLSCDDAKSSHFPIKPNAVNNERDRANKRRNRPGQINRRAFHEIDPDAPRANPEGEQRRENDEDDVKTFKRHLTNDRVVPRQKRKPKKSEHKKAGENQNAIDEPLFRGEMHENCGDQSSL